jgi:hypothetical protein
MSVELAVGSTKLVGRTELATAVELELERTEVEDGATVLVAGPIFKGGIGLR